MSAALSQTTGTHAGFDAVAVDDAMGFTSRPMGENLASGVPAAAGRPSLDLSEKWTQEDDDLLIYLVSRKTPWRKCGLACGRTAKACRMRAQRLMIKRGDPIPQPAAPARPIVAKASMSQQQIDAAAHYRSKAAQKPLVELLCLSCRKPFMSWDRKANRMCQPCKDAA